MILGEDGKGRSTSGVGKINKERGETSGGSRFGKWSDMA
jgi:hypothetical protein